MPCSYSTQRTRRACCTCIAITLLHVTWRSGCDGVDLGSGGGAGAVATRRRDRIQRLRRRDRDRSAVHSLTGRRGRPVGRVVDRRRWGRVADRYRLRRGVRDCYETLLIGRQSSLEPLPSCRLSKT